MIDLGELLLTLRRLLFKLSSYHLILTSSEPLLVAADKLFLPGEAICPVIVHVLIIIRADLEVFGGAEPSLEKLTSIL